jgi:hypothetical protein
MAESGGILMPDGRVTAEASTGLVLERVHEPDEALEHALGRSPGTTLLDHLAVSSGDEAGTVHITVRSTAERFVAVLAWSDSSPRTTWDLYKSLTPSGLPQAGVAAAYGSGLRRRREQGRLLRLMATSKRSFGATGPLPPRP